MKTIIKNLTLAALLSMFSLQNVHAEKRCLTVVKVSQQNSTILKRSLSNPEIVLDFDGDGFSDVSHFTDTGRLTRFTSISSASNTTTTVNLPKGATTPGDYDGDGKWDFATVNKGRAKYSWNINLSSTGQSRTVSFGNKGASIISGCRFLTASKYSLATFENGKLKATELDSTGTRTLTFSKLSSANIIGCGDTNGDGIDELILSSNGENLGEDSIQTVSCSNDFVEYSRIPKNSAAFVIIPGQTGIPAIARIRPAGDRKLLRVRVLYDDDKYPSIYFPKDNILSYGIFSDGGSPTLGILVQDPKTGNVITKLMSENASANGTITVPTKARLLLGQNIYSSAKVP